MPLHRLAGPDELVPDPLDKTVHERVTEAVRVAAVGGIPGSDLAAGRWPGSSDGERPSVVAQARFSDTPRQQPQRARSAGIAGP